MFERFRKKPLEDTVEPGVPRVKSARELLEATGVRVHGYVDTGEAVRYPHDTEISSIRALESVYDNEKLRASKSN